MRLSIVGCYAALCVITAAGAAAENTAILTGQLEMEGRGTSAPKSLRLRLQSRGDNGGEFSGDCEVAHRAWICRVPDGTFDAELYASGYAPVYRWNVVLQPQGTVDAGTLRLTRGSSVVGKVSDHSFGLKGVQVELVPASELSQEDARRNRLRTRQTVTDRKGMYDFADVESGTYSIVAQKEGFSSVSKASIRVEAPREVDIEAIFLKSLIRLQAFISPPVDYWGKPWRVRLNRAVPQSAYQELVRSGTATEAGEWTTTLLNVGLYRLDVLTSQGARVTSSEVDLLQDTLFNIRIDSIPFQGSATVGGRAISGGVALIWEDGSRLTFRTNSDGEFAGILPHEGTWRAVVRFGAPPVELHVPSVSVKRRPDEESAKVRIELPGGAVSGSVVDEQGHAVRAAVLLFRDTALEASGQTNERGEFRFEGLAAGDRQVNATAKSATSGMVRASVSNDEEQHLTLLVRSTVTIRGTLLDAAGNAVPGAMIRYLTPASMAQRTATGLTGDFLISVPAASPVAIAVIAPGLPRKLLNYVPASDEAEQSLRITLIPKAARLHVRMPSGAPPWPFMTRDGTAFFRLPDLFLPRSGGPPAERAEDGFMFDIEPGLYWLCAEPRISDSCVTKLVPAGGEATIVWGAELREGRHE